MVEPCELLKSAEVAVERFEVPSKVFFVVPYGFTPRPRTVADIILFFRFAHAGNVGRAALPKEHILPASPLGIVVMDRYHDMATLNTAGVPKATPLEN